MKLSYGFVAAVLLHSLCAPSSAQDVSQDRANDMARQIFASADVQKLVSPARALRRIDSGQDNPSLAGKVNPSEHPRPYGNENANASAIEVQASYGWYADPVLVIKIKAFVSKEKLAAGKLTDKDFTVREFTATIPDPTGLE